MKRILAVILAAMMLLAFAACGKDDTNTDGTTSATDTVAITDACEVLNTVWATYGDDEKFFAMGGDYNNIVDGAPGKCDITDAEGLAGLLVFPADSVAMIDDAASLLHAMNLNTFTGAVYHVADAANLQTVIDAYKTGVMGNQWMCGFPEKLYIATIGDSYIVTAFGAADIVDNFGAKVANCYNTAVVVCDEALA